MTDTSLMGTSPLPDTVVLAIKEDLHLGSMVGQYRVIERIGRGGMGVVYRARHEGIGNIAAVKVLSPHTAGDASYLRRFLNEARAASRVDHPGLVKIFDFGQTESGVPYILMEHLTGEVLRARMERPSGQGMPTADATRIARQAASALAAAHDAGIVHRDLKPENMMLVADDEAPGGQRVKILDFGIARLAETTQTGPGVVLGTATYMSPEQCVADDQLDGRSDVYSLGVVLYEMLAGEPPFRGGFAVLCDRHLHEVPRPVASLAPAVPEAIARLVHRMLAKEPSLRPDMAQVADAIRQWEGTPHDASTSAAPGASTDAKTPERKLAVRSAVAIDGDAAVRPAAAIDGETHAPPARPARWRRAWIAAPLVLAGAVAAVIVPRLSRPREPVVALTNMVHFPGGTFRMGSTAAEIDAECKRLGAGCRRDLIEREQPVREVTISPFHLDVREVTNEELAAWLQMATPTLEVSEDPEYHIERWVREREEGLLLVDLYPDQSGVLHRAGSFGARPGYEHKPAIQVTWDAARLYCKARGKRLPTEAEWELAARGTSSRRFPWGDEPPRCDGVVFGRDPQTGCRDSAPGPQAVGTAPQDRTPEGVFDMGGNVGEWVVDQFLLPYYPSCGSCVDPKVEGNVPVTDDLRVFRGGSWESPEMASRTTTRSRWKRTDVMTGLGFRCASQ